MIVAVHKSHKLHNTNPRPYSNIALLVCSILIPQKIFLLETESENNERYFNFRCFIRSTDFSDY